MKHEAETKGICKTQNSRCSTEKSHSNALW